MAFAQRDVYIASKKTQQRPGRPTRTIETLQRIRPSIEHHHNLNQSIQQRTRPTRSTPRQVERPSRYIVIEQRQRPSHTKRSNMNNFSISKTLDFKTVSRQLSSARTKSEYETIQLKALAHALPTTVIAVNSNENPLKELLVDPKQVQQFENVAPRQRSVWYNLGFNAFKQSVNVALMTYGPDFISNYLGINPIVAATLLLPVIMATTTFVIDKNKNITLDKYQIKEWTNGVKAAFISTGISKLGDTFTGGTSGIFFTALDTAVKSEIASVVVGKFISPPNLPVDIKNMQPRPEEINVKDFNDSRIALGTALVASVAATYIINGSAVGAGGYAKSVIDAMGGSKMVFNSAIGLGKEASDRIWRRSGMSEYPVNKKLKKMKDDLSEKLSETFLKRSIQNHLLVEFGKNVTKNTLVNLASGYAQNGVLTGKWTVDTDIYNDFTISKSNIAGMWKKLSETGSATFENVMKYTGAVSPAIVDDIKISTSPEYIALQQKIVQEELETKSEQTLYSRDPDSIKLEALQTRLALEGKNTNAALKAAENLVFGDSKQFEDISEKTFENTDELEKEYSKIIEQVRKDMFQEVEAIAEPVEIEDFKQVEALKTKQALKDKHTKAAENLYGDSRESSTLENEIELERQRGLKAGQDFLLKWNQAAQELSKKMVTPVNQLSEETIANYLQNPSYNFLGSLRDISMPTTSIINSMAEADEVNGIINWFRLHNTPEADSLPPEVVDAIKTIPKAEAALEFDTETINVMKLLTAARISNERFLQALTPDQASALQGISPNIDAVDFVAVTTSKFISENNLGSVKTLEDVKTSIKNNKDFYVNSNQLQEVVKKINSLKSEVDRQIAIENQIDIQENIKSDAEGIKFGRFLEGMLWNREEASRNQVLYELVFSRAAGRRYYGK